MENLPNLLIVDDHKENLALLENIIKKINVNLIQAQSGPEALEITHGVELALAIIDVRMPGMNGYELALIMNKERSEEKVPIIFLTASNVNESQVIEGYGFGAVDYMFKPIDSNILVSKINVFLDLFNQKQTITRDTALLKKSAYELTIVNTALKQSEEKYRSYIDNAPDGVFVADENGKYIEVNEAACRITGYSEDELLKMSISDILPAESYKDGLAHFRKVVTTGTSKVDMLFKHKSGTNRWWAVEAVKISETRFLGFTKDITGRMQMEESLRLSEEKYRLMIDTMHESVVVAQDGRLKFFNHMTLNLLEDYSAQELFDIPFVEFIHPDDRKIVFENHQRRILKEEVHPTYTFRVVTREGTVKWVEINAVLFEWQGKPATLNFLNEITKRKHSEEALRESEALFRSVVYNSSDLTILTDEQGITTFCSPQCKSVIGFPGDKFIGQKIPDIIHPDDVAMSQQAWEKVIHQKQGLRDFEYRIVDSEGMVRWLSHTADWIKKDDKVYGIQNTISNITKRKQAEQALRISEEKYKTMLNASPDGILLIDLKGIITEVSEIGLELFGADNKDDLVGKDVYQFVPYDEANTIKDIFEKTTNEGLVQNIGIKIKKKNQSIFFSEISSTLIQSPQGAPLSFMIIIRDISQRKKMETKQIHADRMANLGEMASGIAHEINQPLNIISMVMDKILFESAKTEFINLEFLKKKSDKIFENITRMRNIIDHIRAFSRSHEDYLLTAFDINTSIENAASMILEQFKHLGISLEFQLEAQIPQILGNTYKFEQVILNLLVNAKDAVIEKKARQTEYFEMIVGIKSYLETQFLIVEILDNGIGINNDDIQHIILPFYTTKDEGKGTGLGLTICYQIIKEMGGTIEITSDGFQGTKIKLILESQKKK